MIFLPIQEKVYYNELIAILEKIEKI